MIGKVKPAIALHGGSGTILRRQMTPEREARYREALLAARSVGWEILLRGGSALDAAEAAARVLEDCPLFNAGRGSVYTARGDHEMDAAVMCGRTLRAGAVAAVKTVRNPITLARSVMEEGRFVFLAGPGAEAYADQTQCERVDPQWLGTAERWRQLEQARLQDRTPLDHDDEADGAAVESAAVDADATALPPEGTKYGTIGVVALDQQGDLAACTSTGGLTNKRFGRVGDSPVIGAGTYANNRSCAVSCTGYGEEFIRSVVAHDIACRMEYLQETLLQASTYVVMHKLPLIGGSGGLVAVDAAGNVALPFNTDGMYRAWQNAAGEGVAIFADASAAPAPKS